MPERKSRRRSGNGAEGAAARSLWSGSISFGLVSVPVELHAASRRTRVSMRMLGPDGTPLARRYVCPEDGRVLRGDEIERGYEVAEDEFVIVSDEDLEQLAPRRSREIALERFVARDDIDPAWFMRSYFLVPGAEQRRAYRLLAETMEATGRAGIASFVMRGRAYAVAIFADRDILRAETLRFGDELRSPADVGLPEPKKPPAARVKEMARQIEALSDDALDPAELEDDQAERTRALAERKRERGEDVVEVEVEEAAEDEDGEAAPGEVIDLMALLKRRLQGRGGGGTGGRRGRRSGADAADLEQATKQELYERAKALDIPGRSRMSRDELLASLRRAG